MTGHPKHGIQPDTLPNTSFNLSRIIAACPVFSIPRGIGGLSSTLWCSLLIHVRFLRVTS